MIHDVMTDVNAMCMIHPYRIGWFVWCTPILGVGIGGSGGWCGVGGIFGSEGGCYPTLWFAAMWDSERCWGERACRS